MQNSEYWKQRFTQLEAAQNRMGAETFADIERQYQRAQREIEGQIARWHQRFADNNGITLAEARKMLDKGELKELKWDIQEYIKYGQENAVSGKWMKELENASARFHISRLEALKIQTQQSMETLFARQNGALTAAMGKMYKSSYYRTAYEVQKGFNIGWDIAGVDQRTLEKVISKPWAADGKNFSERIWSNKERLIREVHNELTQNILLGADPQKAIDKIAKKMNTSKHNAGRLVMTEEAYFSSAAQRDCFNELDVEQYEIVATLDSHTSDICRSLDGKVFPMKDYEAGVTAPPFHVYCRSTTVPYFDDDFGQPGERAARDEETGKTYYVPADMSYQDWKEAFVDGGDKSGLVEHRDENKMLHYKRNTELQNTFVPAKTIEEAQTFAEQYCEQGSIDRTFKGKADFKGISLEHANEINEALEEIYQSYDIPKISGIKTIDPKSAKGKKLFSSSDTVMAYSPAENGIYVNKAILKNKDTLDAYNRKGEEAWDIVMGNMDKLSGRQRELAERYKAAGRDLVGNGTVKDYFMHEMGHHMQWEGFDGKTYNAVGEKMSQYSGKISGYATASKSEYFAESFAAYMKGERDILDPDYVAFLDKKLIAKDAGSGIIKPRKEDLSEYLGKKIVKTDNQSVREWYYANVSDIPNQIDKTKSFDEQVKQAFELRNKYKHEARVAMSDVKKAQELEEIRPAPSFEELVESKMKRKNMTREEALQDILKTASKTNSDVNKEFGL